MDEADEVEAYASAAAQAYLDSLDNLFVEQVLSVGLQSGWLLDIGTGPGAIPLKIAQRCPELKAVGIDRSPRMIRTARRAAAQQGLTDRVSFMVGDAYRLGFPDACFDLVISNSLLHHLHDPLTPLDEMARVAKSQGVILLRDLSRPSRLAFSWHVRWYGRHYSGLMKKLYIDSVRAAYAGDELAGLLRRSALPEARIFRQGRTHLGFIRDGRNRGRV